MNLMIVLVPILLINMVFANDNVLELNFPDVSTELDYDEDASVQLQILILPNSLQVSDGNGTIIKDIANSVTESTEYDFILLGEVMQVLKTRYPDNKDITVLAQKNTTYQTVVSVMDSIRSFEANIAGSPVDAELFPNISISDAPENTVLIKAQGFNNDRASHKASL
jgi:biopolymer transport protein ExbD